MLDQLLVDVREGRSRECVLRGEAGVGKTALLDYLARAASGCHVVRTAGIESEMELAHAGLHQICGSLLNGLERLPVPQREALSVAFGLQSGPVPDRFMVGLAVLGLLSEAAEERPQVCVVDDAQWLDHASVQALAFVARRLFAERVALVFAVREGSDSHGLGGLAEWPVRGLADGDARALLDEVIQGPVDDRVREQSFLQHLDTLAPDTRRLLVVAAADPIGDVRLLWGAASRLSIGMEMIDEAEAAELITVGSRVHLRHPLVRSAVYRSASASERRETHRVLAEATDGAMMGLVHAALAWITWPSPPLDPPSSSSTGRSPTPVAGRP